MVRYTGRTFVCRNTALFLLCLIYVMITRTQPTDALVCARPSQSSFSKTVRVVEDLRNGVINFECRRSKQRLIGPQNKTCNESTGDWVPEKNPICEWFCENRRTGLSLRDSDIVKVSQDCKSGAHPGSVTPPSTRIIIKFKCQKGKLKRRQIGHCPNFTCSAADLPSSSELVIQTVGGHTVNRITILNKDEAVLLSCKQGYKLSGRKRVVCTQRGWKYGTSEPKCIRKSTKPNQSD